VINIEVGAAEDALDAIATAVTAATLASVIAGAALVEAGGKARAPVKRGTLRRSISMGSPQSIGEGVFQSSGGPSIIYARRRELGFHGRDSLGRNVLHDPGKPYFGPAVDAAQVPIRALFVSNLSAAVEA
jgi:hypothetical protein